MEIKFISQPESRLPIINNPTLYLKEQQKLAAINYSNEGSDSRLFLIDVTTLESEWVQIPDQQYGAYGFCLGSDGNLYMGFASGQIYRYFPKGKRFECLMNPFPGMGKLTWGGGASSRGRIYMGVYPTGEITEYDIASRESFLIAPYGNEGVTGVYPRDMIELPDGNMLFLFFGAQSSLQIYDPVRQTIIHKEEITDAAKKINVRSAMVLDQERVIYTSATALVVYNFLHREWETPMISGLDESIFSLCHYQGMLLGAGRGTGIIYKIEQGKIVPFMDAPPHGNLMSGGIHITPDEKLTMVCDNGLVLQRDVSGEVKSKQVANTSNKGMRIHMLVKDENSDMIVGSHFINSQIFKVDMQTGETSSSLYKITSTGGQVTCGVFYQHKCYLGVYGKAVFMEYDPSEKFCFQKNPRILAYCGQEQNRPIGMERVGQYLYMATRANYGVLGGAICRLDLETEEVEVFRHFAGAQNPVSFFYDRSTGLFVGTTHHDGDQGSCVPVEPSACLYVWDPESCNLVRKLVPWETRNLRGEDISPDGTLVGFGEDKYFLYHVGSDSLQVRESKHPAPISVKFLDDESLLITRVAEGGLMEFLVIDVASGKETSLGVGEAVRLHQKIGDRRFLVSSHPGGQVLDFSCDFYKTL